MLQLQHIILYQFKNYMAEQFRFSSRVVGICGNNGQGKTNLLDAIYYLCFSKSYFSKTDAANVHKGMQGLRLEGSFLKGDELEKVVCILRENNKKEVLRNGQEYKRLSMHIGEFPVVIIAPDDVELILGNSEVRRRFVDTLLSQLNNDYLQALIVYNKVLLQRNSMLKQAAERGYIDDELLAIVDHQLVEPGNLIFETRRTFLDQFLPKVAVHYNRIAGSNEAIDLNYYSPLLEDDFATLLQTYRQKDLMLQRTTIGVHKDDIELTLYNEPLKNIASQGQRKSLLFALKLAAFDQLKEAKGYAPLLLLDDVFEKLDNTRMNNLLRQVCVENDGQVFITDTDKERLQQAFASLAIDYQLIELQ